MLRLEIYSSYSKKPLSTTVPINNLKLLQITGITRLLCHLLSDFGNPSALARSTCVFIVAIPSNLTPDGFLSICEAYIDKFKEVVFIRNDKHSSYSLLITLGNELDADCFYESFNGKKFTDQEDDLFHMYFIQFTNYKALADVKSTPLDGYAVLPSCPVCLEILDQKTSGIRITSSDHSSRCCGISKWGSVLACQVCKLCQDEKGPAYTSEEDEKRPECLVCETSNNLCTCLICGTVSCRSHASKHCDTERHYYSLELETQKIYDYKLGMNVHRWSKGDLECTTCALVRSKVDSIVEEFNLLYASQLEIHRQQSGSLQGATQSSINKAVKDAILSKKRELHDKIRVWEEERLLR